MLSHFISGRCISCRCPVCSYDESPAAACVAPGISQPKLTKLIREAKVRSINIGRTRLIEKAADVRRMATAAR